MSEQLDPPLDPEYFIGKEVIIDTKAGAGEYGARLAARDLNKLRSQLAESIANKKYKRYLAIYGGETPEGFHLNRSYQETYRGHAGVGHELDWDIYDTDSTVDDYPAAMHVFCIDCKTYWVVEQNVIRQAVMFFRFSICEKCGKTSDLPHSNFCRCKEQIDDRRRIDWEEEEDAEREIDEEIERERQRWSPVGKDGKADSG